MASATNTPSTAKNYKALASYINTKELPWFEWFPGHYLKLCKLNPITGQIITFIRSVTGVSLDVHFHPGTVVVYTVQGAWTYDEGWVAEAGDVVFEVAGSTHSPRMCGKEETIVLAIIEGALEFRDAKGNVTFVENWQTLLKRYHDYCAKEGIAPVDITSFETSSR
jgi:2,4'-dihydroxyacetophenone dioxygenase